jgi:hypothetical protein
LSHLDKIIRKIIRYPQNHPLPAVQAYVGPADGSVSAVNRANSRCTVALDNMTDEQFHMTDR